MPEGTVVLSDFHADLRGALTDPGRLLDRDLDRIALAADASHYALTPRAAVVAASAEEVGRLLAVAAAHGVPAVFRSGGTSLSGQGITDGLLVETRRHFRSVDIRDNGATVALGTGVTVREVNVKLAPYGRKLGPDPASESACTIGGVVANNSSGMTCGTHANTYRTLASMTFVLPSGTVIDTADRSADDELRGREPALHRGLADLRDRVRSDPAAVREIERQFAMKNTMGYGVNSFLDHDSPVDILAHLMIGSEGTLGFVAQAVFRTVPVLPHAATGLLLFPTLAGATEALGPLILSGAHSLELLDAASLRVAQRDPLADDALRAAVVTDHAALLVEYQAIDADELAELSASADSAVARFTLVGEGALTRDAGRRGRLWRIRKGLFTAIAGARPPGTTSLLEDIVVPPEALTDTCSALRQLLTRHRYADAAIFGHARDANMHFLLTQAFETAADIGRYADFTEDMVDLVLANGGSLKAEHGTGRVMAPFVRRQYGDVLYEVMREIKRLCDPAGVLNPGVILDEDPGAHLRHLKVVPAVDPEVDRCVECGYCEQTCPSRNLTTSPRQRITLRRAIASMAPGDPARESVVRDYEYDAVDTCAADGMCVTNCPVGINTGELMKRLRAERHGPSAQRTGVGAARHWQGLMTTARAGLRAGNAAPAVAAIASGAARRVLGADAVPAWVSEMPAARRGRPPSQLPAGPEAVFFPSCLNDVFAPEAGQSGAAQAFLTLCDRAGIEVTVPRGVRSLCCATPLESKGFTQGAETMAALVVSALWESSRGGELPIVTDASSCTHGLAGLAGKLHGSALTMHDGMRFLDATTFVAASVLPGLTISRRLSSLALHPTCSSVHLGAGDALRELASAVADEVFVPDAWGCCAYAGDRGMLHPELTGSATAAQAREINSRPFAAYASANRTCELGMTKATGQSYRHILEILADVTTPTDHG